MRRLPISTHGAVSRNVQRVISLSAFTNEWEPTLNFLVSLASQQEAEHLERLVGVGHLTNVSACIPKGLNWHSTVIPTISCDITLLELHDVVIPNPKKRDLTVLYRNSDMHHAIQLTNRCNSFCLMCSQPPTSHDDQWMAEEAFHVAAHINDSPSSIGLSGGEPLLLGVTLRKIIDVFTTKFPETNIDVLTNGRLLSDNAIANELLTGINKNVSWLVPLYGHADFLHDFVVQSPGAFEQTIGGLLTLQSHAQPIQLRIVLIEPTLRVLPELCRFIARNLPFVREVALMGCEPIGFALANRDTCEVDLENWHSELVDATNALRRANVPFLFMNTPFCSLPNSLWKHAHQSISDWKRTFAGECSACSMKTSCSGLFAWYSRGWSPAKIKAIEERVCSDEIH